MSPWSGFIHAIRHSPRPADYSLGDGEPSALIEASANAIKTQLSDGGYSGRAMGGASQASPAILYDTSSRYGERVWVTRAAERAGDGRRPGHVRPDSTEETVGYV